MPAYEFCNELGECFDELYLRHGDAPQTIFREGRAYLRQFPNPAVRFRGAFSGNTTQIIHPDDGTVIEPGVKNEQKQKKIDADDRRDQDRRDFLAEQVSTYDL
jgi:hypothetical protein